MSHENDEVRNELFRAINKGMSEAFSEDNISTRMYSTIKWLAENDPEIQALYSRSPGCLEAVGGAAKDGIIKANIIK